MRTSDDMIAAPANDGAWDIIISTFKFKFTCENSQSHVLECVIYRPISCEYVSPIFFFFFHEWKLNPQ